MTTWTVSEISVQTGLVVGRRIRGRGNTVYARESEDKVEGKLVLHASESLLGQLHRKADVHRPKNISQDGVLGPSRILIPDGAP